MQTVLPISPQVRVPGDGQALYDGKIIVVDTPNMSMTSIAASGPNKVHDDDIPPSPKVV
jgi:hypothetical protein